MKQRIAKVENKVAPHARPAWLERKVAQLSVELNKLSAERQERFRLELASEDREKGES
jgi:hypothetical protein